MKYKIGDLVILDHKQEEYKKHREISVIIDISGSNSFNWITLCFSDGTKYQVAEFILDRNTRDDSYITWYHIPV